MKNESITSASKVELRTRTMFVFDVLTDRDISIGEIVRAPHFSDSLAKCQCVLVRTYLIFMAVIIIIIFSGARYYSACSEFSRRP